MRPTRCLPLRRPRSTRPGPRRLALALAAACLTGLALAGCGEPVDPLAPPEIRYGEDVCDACAMIISEPRFAAATIVERAGEAEPLLFDDIGDMATHHGLDLETPVLAWWVHDYDSEAWLDARSARFVRALGIRSPMGHGLAAFADPERAEAFAAEMEGEVLDLETLLGRPVEPPAAAGAEGG